MAYDTILPSAARAATGDSGAIVVGTGEDLRLDLALTASAVPTSLNVVVEQTNDGGNTWVLLKAFAQLGAVATGSESVHIPRPTSGVIRARWTVVGTSFTFSVVLRRELP